MVYVEDDVQNVIRDMKAISDRLYVWYDPHQELFIVGEHCVDGVDRLVFTTPTLDQRVVHRLRAADHWHGRDLPTHVLGDDEDFVAAIDRHNAGVEARDNERLLDKLYDAGERIAWAMDSCNDLNSPGGKISVPRDI